MPKETNEWDPEQAAYERFRKEYSDDFLFFYHPFLFQIREPAVNSNTFAIQHAIRHKVYSPSMALVVNTPKPNWHVRPGSVLTLDDHLAYNTLVCKCLPILYSRLGWSEEKIRQSHIISKSTKHWFEFPLDGWVDFRKKSVSYLQNTYSHVVVTDIAGYYENIDIGHLIQALSQDGVDKCITEQLQHCLVKWAGPRGRGIPQGYRASDLLAEYYLDPVDRQLHSLGFTHLRYSDDMRIFTNSVGSARKALLSISVILRGLGLTVQTAKSDILTSNDAKGRFSQVVNAVEGVGKELAAELQELGAGDISMRSVGYALKRYLEAKPDAPPVEVIRRAWKNFVSTGTDKFNKTLFHYLLARLASIKSPVAIDYVISTLQIRPEETKYCLKHLTVLRDSLVDYQVDGLAQVLSSPKTLFPYQRYELLRWFTDMRVNHLGVLDYARSVINRGFQGEKGVVLQRPWAIAYLGLFGNNSDILLLTNSFSYSPDSLDRATILCAAGHRNPLLIQKSLGEGGVVSLARTHVLHSSVISKDT